MRVIFVSVHPDDETLGCGGTILKHKNAGDEIYWLNFTRPSTLHGFDSGFVSKREEEIKAISDFYGFTRGIHLGLPAMRLHALDIGEMIQRVSEIINQIQPEIVYTVNRSDVHTDHQVAATVMASCTKAFRYPFIKRVLMYECISETEMAYPLPENIFVPNVYSDITDNIDGKLHAMGIYASEMQNTPLPRSIENIRALARFRGASVAVHYAEAFMLIRDIV